MKLIEAKTCGKCKKEWKEIPTNAKFVAQATEHSSFDGYWWDCECKSNLFVPVSKIEAKAS